MHSLWLFQIRNVHTCSKLNAVSDQDEVLQVLNAMFVAQHVLVMIMMWCSWSSMTGRDRELRSQPGFDVFVTKTT